MGLVTSHVISLSRRVSRVCVQPCCVVYTKHLKRMPQDTRHIGFAGFRASRPACNRGAAVTSFYFVSATREGETEIVAGAQEELYARTRLATRASSNYTKVDAGPLAPTKRQRPRHRRLLREHVTVALDVVHGGVGGSAQRFCARLYLASACRIQGSAHGDARSANCH
jgi:hypothetical protein